MKLPSIAKIRIPILTALAVCELVGLVYFYSQRSQVPHGEGYFNAFIFLSAMGTPLAIPALWIDWMRRRGVTYSNVFVAVALSEFAFNSWSQGELIYALFCGGMAALLTLSVLARLIRPVDKEKQERNLEAIKAEINRLSSITKYTSMLALWLALMAWSISECKTPIPPLDLILIILPALWFAWMLVFHLFIRRDRKDDAVISDDNIDQGGRA